jgi:hypothetical protein
VLADFPVLAEDAMQVAETEKDGPAPLRSPQAALFTKVREGRRDDRMAPGVADAALV